MAIVKNDPFPGTDYTKYQDWPKVVLPSGEVLYEVPGNPAYTYDPVASNATGRKVFRRNPKEAVIAAKKDQELKDKQIKQQEFNQSLLGQALPVGLSLGGLYAANQLAGSGAPSLGGLFGSGAATTAAPEVAAAAAPAVSSAAPVLAGEAAAPGFFSGIGPMASGYGGAGVLPLAGIAAATYLGGKSAYDMLRGKEDKSIPGLIGRGTLGIATGGLSELAKPLFGHKSTRERAREHTQELFNQAGDDKTTQDYLHAARDQYNSAPPDPSKPFYGGRYGSFDEYKTAGLNARDLSGVYGNLDTYGAKEWANLTQDQREAVTQANIDMNNYTSDKGEVKIIDPNRALRVFETLKANGFKLIPKSDEIGDPNTGQPYPASQIPSTIIDAATKGATQPKWIRRNGQIVKVA